MKNNKKEISESLVQIKNKCVIEKVSNIDKFGLCKTTDINYCEHMVNYGYAKYCFHPEWKSFIERKESPTTIIK